MLFLSGQVVVSHADEPVLIPAARLAADNPERARIVHLKYILYADAPWPAANKSILRTIRPGSLANLKRR